MSIEKLDSSAEKKDLSERDLERDLSGLENGLQRILNDKDVNYAEEMKKIEEHLAVMKKKYEGKEKIIGFIDAFGSVFLGGGIALAIGSFPLGYALGSPATSLMMGAEGMAGMSIKALSEFAVGPTKEKAEKLKNNIEDLINKSREFTSVYLHKGGAEYDARGRLEVTKEQVEWARGMEEDNRKKSIQ